MASTFITYLDESGDEGFAFGVVTPDDFVQPADDGARDDDDDEEYYQMRPNVRFELGWFHGHLRRDRTCLLYKKGPGFRRTSRES